MRFVIDADREDSIEVKHALFSSRESLIQFVEALIYSADVVWPEEVEVGVIPALKNDPPQPGDFVC
jgi:hypothetical protein